MFNDGRNEMRIKNTENKTNETNHTAFYAVSVLKLFDTEIKRRTGEKIKIKSTKRNGTKTGRERVIGWHGGTGWTF